MPYGYQFLDVFPIRNYKSLEAKFIAQDVSQDMMIDVSGNAIDLCRVDHHRVRAGFDCRLECRQEIFAQIILRDPCGSAIAAAKREAVTHVVFQTGGDMVRRADIGSFQTAHKSRAHYFGEIWILAKGFVEAWPERLTADIEHR